MAFKANATPDKALLISMPWHQVSQFSSYWQQHHSVIRCTHQAQHHNTPLRIVPPMESHTGHHTRDPWLFIWTSQRLGWWNLRVLTAGRNSRNLCLTELPHLRPFRFCISGPTSHSHVFEKYSKTTRTRTGCTMYSKSTPLSSKETPQLYPYLGPARENVPREMQLNRVMGNSALDMTLLLNHWHQLSFMFTASQLLIVSQRSLTGITLPLLLGYTVQECNF